MFKELTILEGKSKRQTWSFRRKNVSLSHICQMKQKTLANIIIIGISIFHSLQQHETEIHPPRYPRPLRYNGMYRMGPKGTRCDLCHRRKTSDTQSTQTIIVSVTNYLSVLSLLNGRKVRTQIL